MAVCAVIVRDGRVLAMRRAITKDAAPGAWETVSGRVHADEEPIDAVRREIAEECGLDVTLSSKPVTTYEAMRGDEPMTVIVYSGTTDSSAVRRSHEHDEHRWCTASEFAKLCPFPQLVDVVRSLLTN